MLVRPRLTLEDEEIDATCHFEPLSEFLELLLPTLQARGIVILS